MKINMNILQCLMFRSNWALNIVRNRTKMNHRFLNSFLVLSWKISYSQGTASENATKMQKTKKLNSSIFPQFSDKQTVRFNRCLQREVLKICLNDYFLLISCAAVKIWIQKIPNDQERVLNNFWYRKIYSMI